MVDEWCERKSKKLCDRDWEKVRENWQAYIPTIHVAGTPSADEIGEMPNLQVELQKVASDNLQLLDTPVLGLRQAILHEGIYLLHKAAHVLGAAQVHIDEGMCCWSVSTAYQGAFFAMNAVVHFLGIAVVESGNKTYLVDVWASDRKKKVKVKDIKTLLANTKRVEQRHMWYLFQRCLGITVNANTFWDFGCVDALAQLDHKDFGRHRNDLHYGPQTWYGVDLHACFIDAAFGVHTGSMTDGSCIQVQNYGFSLLLGFVLFRMAYRMLAEIGASATAIQEELKLIAHWLSQPHSSMYVAAYP